MTTADTSNNKHGPNLAELLLLAFAVLIVVAAEAAVEANQDGRISSHLVTYAAVPLAIGLIAHLVIRRVAPYADPVAQLAARAHGQLASRRPTAAR